MRIGTHFLYGAYSTIALVIMLLWIDPARYTNRAQSTILEEYKSIYCMNPEEARKIASTHASNAAMLSRIVAGANLGIIATAEYARCRYLR